MVRAAAPEVSPVRRDRYRHQDVTGYGTRHVSNLLAKADGPLGIENRDQCFRSGTTPVASHRPRVNLRDEFQTGRSATPSLPRTRRPRQPFACDPIRRRLLFLGSASKLRRKSMRIKNWTVLATGFAKCVLVVGSAAVCRPVGWRPFMLINGIDVRTCRNQHRNDVGRAVPRRPM